MREREVKVLASYPIRNQSPLLIFGEIGQKDTTDFF
jgi:hypothetical protein